LKLRVPTPYQLRNVVRLQRPELLKTRRRNTFVWKNFSVTSKPSAAMARFSLRVIAPFILFLSSAAAQDIRGVESCMAEKQIERRTGCLQANIEFLQQTVSRLARETQDKIGVMGRDLAAARAEIAALRLMIEKLNTELAQMKAKAEPGNKK
jgi:hypothetical protein